MTTAGINDSPAIQETSSSASGDSRVVPSRTGEGELLSHFPKNPTIDDLWDAVEQSLKDAEKALPVLMTVLPHAMIADEMLGALKYAMKALPVLRRSTVAAAPPEPAHLAVGGEQQPEASATRASLSADGGYDAGWRVCAQWANRPDLLADMDSPAYARDREAALKKYHWPGPGPEPASWYAPDGTKVYRSYEDYCLD